jgi:predicted ATPase
MRTPVKRYIITGAPGTGKSSVLEALRNMGFACFQEASRAIIKQQQASEGSWLPWQNLRGFAGACYAMMLEDCRQAQEGVNFYDRAIPDIVAYLHNKSYDVPNRYLQGSNCYQKEVFFFPVWPAIFVNDPQRPETIEEAMKLEQQLWITYEKLGFEIHKMPLVSIQARAQQIKEVVENRF